MWFVLWGGREERTARTHLFSRYASLVTDFACYNFESSFVLFIARVLDVFFLSHSHFQKLLKAIYLFFSSLQILSSSFLGSDCRKKDIFPLWSEIVFSGFVIHLCMNHIDSCDWRVAWSSREKLSNVKRLALLWNAGILSSSERAQQQQH